jgi:transportin-3
MTEAIAHVIKSVESGKVLEYMEKFCLGLASRLHVIGQTALPSERDDQVLVVKDIEDLLDQLAVFLQHVVPKVGDGEEHPLVPFMSKMWPLLASLLGLFGGEARVCESVCRVLRYSIDSMRGHLSPLLPDIVTAMVGAYGSGGSSSFLWMAKKIVRVYAGDGGGGELRGVVEQMGGISVGILSSVKRLDDVPDGMWTGGLLG